MRRRVAVGRTGELYSLWQTGRCLSRLNGFFSENINASRRKIRPDHLFTQVLEAAIKQRIEMAPML